MRVRVDTDRCIGSSQCVFSAPDVFDQDDDGTVVLLHESVDLDREAAVRKAADLCPARVITVDDE